MSKNLSLPITNKCTPWQRVFWLYMLAIMTFCVCSRQVVAQQPAAQPLPCPLERPQPIGFAFGGDPGILLDQISDLVQEEGFRIEKLDGKYGELVGWRPSDSPHSESDRVVVWLERSLAIENEVRVFFLYGHFEKAFGVNEERRVMADPSQESQVVGGLRQKIIQLLQRERR